MSIRINELETYLGLDEGFFHLLQSEDDWTLIIKLHSLLESSCNVLLTEEFGRPEAFDAFANIQVGSTKSGKLAFIKALDLLSGKEIDFIEQLGWVRNKFAHNVANTQSSLVGLIESAHKSKRRELRKAFVMNIDNVIYSEKELTGTEFVKIYPQQAIWASATQVLEMMRLRIIAGKKRQEFVQKKITQHINEYGPIVIREGETKLQ